MMSTDDMAPPTDEQVDAFPHDDILDMRDLLDDEDTAPVLVAAMLGDGLATDVDDVQQYAENEPILIADYFFEDYARELAEDIGAIDGDAGWPGRHIDWKAAAEELLYDYSSVTIAGRVYHVRAF